MRYCNHHNSSKHGRQNCENCMAYAFYKSFEEQHMQGGNTKYSNSGEQHQHAQSAGAFKRGHSHTKGEHGCSSDFAHMQMLIELHKRMRCAKAKGYGVEAPQAMHMQNGIHHPNAEEMPNDPRSNCQDRVNATLHHSLLNDDNRTRGCQTRDFGTLHAHAGRGRHHGMHGCRRGPEVANRCELFGPHSEMPSRRRGPEAAHAEQASFEVPERCLACHKGQVRPCPPGHRCFE
ncbi:hypothetical protein LJB93_02925 [Desulfovibrio sp. OttesenSCG-928-F07]|nr:hypothetical protein [Desulfovibrio sp. OttesenSCG-928-F07]